MVVSTSKHTTNAHTAQRQTASSSSHKTTTITRGSTMHDAIVPDPKSTSPTTKSGSAGSTQTGTKTGTGTSTGTTPPVDTGIASKSFMSALKTKIEASGDDAASYLQSQAMLAALDQGKLEVDDATTGQAVTAWDPDQTGATATKPTTIAKSSWTTLLNAHLKHDQSGSFEKSAYGRYVDKQPGENCYFGKVAVKYYYVKWPAETKVG